MTREVPTTLYRFYDTDDRLLYVGISERGPERWRAHRKEKPWWTEVARTTTEHYDTRQAALDAERAAIITEQPAYNVVHNRHLSAVEPAATSKQGKPLPTLDMWWAPTALRDAYVAAMLTLDEFLHEWATEIPDESPVATVVAGLELLSISDCCPRCDAPPQPPLSANDGGQAFYRCARCSTAWDCWWSTDLNLIRSVA